MRVNVGVIGLGFMGRRYAEMLARLPEANLVAVCDLRAALAEEVAQQTGAKATTDAAELVEDEAIEAVFICTPEDKHVDVAVAALAQGNAVMIEKPVAHTLAAAQQIADAAAIYKGLVMVGHLLRFEPRWAATQRAIAAGDLGDLVSLSTRRVGNILDQEVLGGRTSIPLYYGVHDLDILRWFAGSEAKTIYAVRQSGILRQAGYDVDDLYQAIITFESGLTAMAELGWQVPAAAVEAPTSGITVAGTKGWARLDQKETGLAYWSERAAKAVHPTFDVMFWADTHGVPGGALANELRHFLHCVATDSQPIISLADAVAALRLSLAMEASAERGAVIDMAEFGASSLASSNTG